MEFSKGFQQLAADPLRGRFLVGLNQIGARTVIMNISDHTDQPQPFGLFGFRQ